MILSEALPIFSCTVLKSASFRTNLKKTKLKLPTGNGPEAFQDAETATLHDLEISFKLLGVMKYHVLHDSAVVSLHHRLNMSQCFFCCVCVSFYFLVEISAEGEVDVSGPSLFKYRNSTAMEATSWWIWDSSLVSSFANATTLQGTNIAHLGKRNILFKKCLGMGYVSSHEGISLKQFKTAGCDFLQAFW